VNIEDLNSFVVRAKRNTYVGNGVSAASCRAGSHNLVFDDGDWSYRDSYFGGLISSVRKWDGAHGKYVDISSGDVAHCHGRETISVDAVTAYALDYFGG
jgi:hypothetical protein